VSYIVSAYSWVGQLPTCLHSLAAQTHQDFEVLVTDNSMDRKAIVDIRRIVAGIHDRRFRYLHTAPLIPVSDCYWSSEVGMRHTSGRWLCFPCDDCYYPPEWGQRMLAEAYRSNADLVLCERSETGPATCGLDGYQELALGSLAFPGYKPSFIVRRERFAGWLNKPVMGACSGVDRTTLQALTRDSRIRWSVARGLYYAHN
jgi:glycosyltransferase involved in cell wall biosynthesis